MKKVNRMSLGIYETPLKRLYNFEKILGENRRFYIKRDDLCGVGLGGNKVRKLEYILEYAKENGYKKVITTGAAQSNHAMLTVACARKAGFEVELYLEGKKPDDIKGNLILERIMGITPKFVSSEKLNETMKNRAEELTSLGEKTLLIPVGGSMSQGIPGYINMVRELKEQCQKEGVRLDRIVCGLGSGGTYAGILLGTKIHNLDVRVTGIEIVPDSRKKQIERLIENACEYLEIDNMIKSEDIDIQNYCGEAYAVPTEIGNKAIAEMSKTEGIFLDPVYTGKTISGIIDMSSRNIIGKDENICFIHTGGAAALFAIPSF